MRRSLFSAHAARASLALTTLAIVALVQPLGADAPHMSRRELLESPERWAIPMPINAPAVPALSAVITPVGGIEDEEGGAGALAAGACPPVTSSHTDANFEGGAFVVQAGFAEQEVAACSYTIAAANFPIQLDLAEMIFATSNTTVTTTTQWSFLVWEGTPQTGTLIAEYSSDDIILPHIVIPPGTNGVNVQVSVDPGDPEQIVIQNNGTATFSIGYRIDQHNNQTANPCFTAPPSNSNAFPTTDTSGLQQSTNNWLYGVNCGTFGCPPNGGWARFSQLNVLCRPSGDWVMRVTWHPVNCSEPVGACCAPAGTCSIQTSADCAAQGGAYMGDNLLCGQVQCPEPNGACCVGTTCVASQTQAECIVQGGVFQGVGSTCGQVNCNPSGACCIPSTGACVSLTQSTCTAVGGLFQGAGVSCAGLVCFPEGACCLPDGSCSDDSGAGLSPEECSALGGTFQGDGTTCAQATCPQPTGACCVNDTCVIFDEITCGLVGGAWAGMLTDCADLNQNGQADQCEVACPEDLDESADVGFGDVLEVLAAWGPCPSCPADLDASGDVGFGDLLAVLAAWGPC